MNVYARVNASVSGKEATFALVNYHHTGKTSDTWEYGWILESGDDSLAEFAPDPMVSLDEMPVWATPTCLV